MLMAMLGVHYQNQLIMFSYKFDKDPSTVEYLKQPVPNPELAKVREGWLDRMADNVADVGSWTWGMIQGDFNENPTMGQIATNAVITMIPVVDQVGDVRDIIAKPEAPDLGQAL